MEQVDILYDDFFTSEAKEETASECRKLLLHREPFRYIGNVSLLR